VPEPCGIAPHQNTAFPKAGPLEKFLIVSIFALRQPHLDALHVIHYLSEGEVALQNDVDGIGLQLESFGSRSRKFP
jgi:hypothetical protein